MKIDFETYAEPRQWFFIFLPEIGFFRYKEEYGFEICWLCFCLQITNG